MGILFWLGGCAWQALWDAYKRLSLSAAGEGEANVDNLEAGGGSDSGVL